MTSQGSAAARFRRALKTRNGLLVRAAAAELGPLGLDHAFAVCLVLAEAEPERYPRAAARWAALLTLDDATIDVSRLRLLVAALDGISDPVRVDESVDAITAIVARLGRRDLAATLEEHAPTSATLLARRR